MGASKADVAAKRAQGFGDFARNQLRNIAPFITLLFLVLFFSIASPSSLCVATLPSLRNLRHRLLLTGINTVVMTFVILTAEIDLSVGAVANATAIVLTFFTLQPDYVNIGNIPMPGAVAIILALLA